jgi:hypothetical protein
MEPVVTHFILHEQEDQYKTYQSRAQADNIDGGRSFVLPQVTPGNFEEVFKHSCSLTLFCS